MGIYPIRLSTISFLKEKGSNKVFVACNSDLSDVPWGELNMDAVDTLYLASIGGTGGASNEIASIRFYSRALDKSELRRNHSVDKNRFDRSNLGFLSSIAYWEKNAQNQIVTTLSDKPALYEGISPDGLGGTLNPSTSLFSLYSTTSTGDVIGGTGYRYSTEKKGITIPTTASAALKIPNVLYNGIILVRIPDVPTNITAAVYLTYSSDHYIQYDQPNERLAIKAKKGKVVYKENVHPGDLVALSFRSEAPTTTYEKNAYWVTCYHNGEIAESVGADKKNTFSAAGIPNFFYTRPATNSMVLIAARTLPHNLSILFNIWHDYYGFLPPPTRSNYL